MYEAEIKFPQPVCTDGTPHAPHRILGTWRDECPGIKAADPAAIPLKGEPGYMSCPRQCDIDVRAHHSSGMVKGGCDTGPMSLDDMSAWFEARGAGRPGFCTVAELIEEHYGKTEDEMDRIYDEMHCC